MSTIHVNTTFNIDLEFEAAPFHRRLFAWFFDIIVLIFDAYTAFQVLAYLSRKSDENSGESIAAVFMVLILPVLTYHLFSELPMNGQSIGKRIMGLRVVNENGGRPSISQFIIRWIIRTSDYMVIVIALNAPLGFNADQNFFLQVAAAYGLLVTDIILVNSSKKNQRLGDMLAHTMLIKTNQKATIHDTIFLQVKNNYTRRTEKTFY
jgi:uncharacterized RDD family membrane protein YckC